MKKMTIVIAVMVAMVLIAGSVFAWGGPGCKAGMGKDGKDCPNKEEMKKQMKKDLGLTDEQEKKLEAAREAGRSETKALHDLMKAKKDELKAAITKPGVTRDQVEPIVAELKELEAKKVEKRVDGIFEVKSILTEEQFAKLEAIKEKHMKEWKDKNKDKGMERGR